MHTGEGGQPTRRSARMQTQKRQRQRRVRSLIAVGVSIAVLAVAAWFVVPKVLDGLSDATTPSAEMSDYPAGGDGVEVTVTIPEGATGNDMAKVLHEADVIYSPAQFVTAFAANERASRIQPGTYKLRTKMAASEAINALLDPVNRADNALTIPEGFHADQVYERIAAQLEVPVDEVKSAASSNDIGLPKEAGNNPEGWLAAQTYNFAPGTTAKEALSQMVAATVKMLDELKIPADQRQAVLTKASIVEREVPPSYYGEVARVIENRINDTAGPTVGKLQMDSTVLYGLGKRGGIPSTEELKIDTPYNTYMHAGLPPTPIGAPSKEAIQAVMNPPEGDWIYFVTVNLDTGETLFTGDLDEHEKNIEKLRQWTKDHPQEEASAESNDN